MTIVPFNGFGYPDENWSKLPHTLIDSLPLVETLAELKIILYVLRHTWGYREYDDAKRITVDEFASGRKDRTGKRLDSGTGLSEPSIRSGIAKAIEHGFVKVDVNDSDKARVEKSYMLRHVDVIQGVKDLPPDERVLPPEGKELTPSTKKVYPRSEKETSERNLGNKPKKEKDIAPNGASLQTPDTISLVENPKPTNGVNPSKELPTNAGASIPPKSSAKIPPPVSKWNDTRLNAYYAENQADINLIAAARGVNHEKSPFNKCVVTDQKDTIKVHIAILARKLEVADYVKFLRKPEVFGWRKQFRVSFSELSSTIAVYESQLYPLKAAEATYDQTPGVRPTRVMVGTEWVDADELRRRKGRAS